MVEWRETGSSSSSMVEIALRGRGAGGEEQ